MKFEMRLLFFVLSFTLTACDGPTRNVENLEVKEAVGLRSLTQEEALSDFRDLVDHFMTLYGPLEYKEKRFGISFDKKSQEFQEKLKLAKTDSEIFSIYAEFVSLFQDGHVGIRFTLNDKAVSSYKIPIFVFPVQNHVVVGNVGKDLAGSPISVGDEVLEVDGQAPLTYLPKILKYFTVATPASNQHFIFRIFDRGFYMTDITPKQNTANVKFKKADGTIYNTELVWQIVDAPLEDSRFVGDTLSNGISSFWKFERADIANRMAENSVMGWGRAKPFFASEQVAQQTKWNQVTADANFRKKFGLKDTETPNIFATLYKHKEKTILLIRNYTYHHQDFSNTVYLNGYRAILNQWEPLADVLVLDQTHNTGGSYCEDFSKLFLKQEGDGFVQALHSDRKWIWDLKSIWPEEMQQELGMDLTPEVLRAYKQMGEQVEMAYDQGLKMTKPLPIIGGSRRIQPDLKYTWKKPMLVLIDELAGSCGDAFPMIIKANGVAKLFGQTTMGLGGNVEAFTLKQTQTQIRLTRGLFTSNRNDGIYTDDQWIENNGVKPDMSYEHSLEDTRNGYLKYVETFSDRAVEQIK